MSKKIAYIFGNSRKGAETPIEGCYIDGELQKRIEKFGEKYNVVDIKFGKDDSMAMVIYEE